MSCVKLTHTVYGDESVADDALWSTPLMSNNLIIPTDEILFKVAKILLYVGPEPV